MGSAPPISEPQTSGCFLGVREDIGIRLVLKICLLDKINCDRLGRTPVPLTFGAQVSLGQGAHRTAEGSVHRGGREQGKAGPCGV